MNKLIFALFISIAATAAQATEIGFMIGSQAGLSAKFGLAQSDRAVDLGVSYHFSSDSSISIHADYLIENARTFPMRNANPFNLYYGIGGRLENIDNGKDSGKTRLGVRAPIGLDYKMNKPDLTFFGEIAAVLDLTPTSYVDFTVGLGARFRF